MTFTLRFQSAAAGTGKEEFATYAEAAVRGQEYEAAGFFVWII